MNNIIICPICNSNTAQIRSLKKEYIFYKLINYYNEQINSKNLINSLKIIDYNIYKCNKCELEFANPLIEGSKNFYDWITKHASYYPQDRWEWFEVKRHIQDKCKKNSTLLEIGCGNGLFLDLMKDVKNINSFGIDITEESIKECRKKELNVSCIDLDSFIKKNNKKKFDFIVMFHCLEHLVNPKELINSALTLLNPNGRLFISTPYSPLIFEPTWFDPLNYPPHHMTRWNEKSYQALADQFNLQIKMYFVKGNNALSRTLYTLNLINNSRSRLQSPFKNLIVNIIRPIKFFREYNRQIKRIKINNQVVDNLILVELNRK